MRHLVDSSVMIAYFRGDPSTIDRLDAVRRDGVIATADPLVMELQAGARERPVTRFGPCSTA